MFVYNSNNAESVLNKHFALKCPHCGVLSNLTAISIPRYEQLDRFQPERVGIAYRCDSCNEPVFLRFYVDFQPDANRFEIYDEPYDEIERPVESFDFKYLPEQIAGDFREASNRT
jgi:hypothetical protein